MSRIITTTVLALSICGSPYLCKAQGWFFNTGSDYHYDDTYEYSYWHVNNDPLDNAYYNDALHKATMASMQSRWMMKDMKQARKLKELEQRFAFTQKMHELRLREEQMRKDGLLPQIVKRSPGSGEGITIRGQHFKTPQEFRDSKLLQELRDENDISEMANSEEENTIHNNFVWAMRRRQLDIDYPQWKVNPPIVPLMPLTREQALARVIGDLNNVDIAREHYGWDYKTWYNQQKGYHDSRFGPKPLPKAKNAGTKPITETTPIRRRSSGTGSNISGQGISNDPHRKNSNRKLPPTLQYWPYADQKL